MRLLFMIFCLFVFRLTLSATITIKAIDVIYQCTPDGKYGASQIVLALDSELTGTPEVKFLSPLREEKTTTCEIQLKNLICQTTEFTASTIYTIDSIVGQTTVTPAVKSIVVYSDKTLKLETIQTTPQLIDYSDPTKNNFKVLFNEAIPNTKLSIIGKGWPKSGSHKFLHVQLS